MSYIRDFIQAPSSIKYLQGASNYSWLYFQDGQKMLIAKPLCYFEERLPDFLRIHKMIIVNPLYIEEFTAPPRSKMAGAVQLQGGVVLPVSRRRWLVVADQLAALPVRRVLAAHAVMPILTEGLNTSGSDIQPLHRHNHCLFVTMTDPFRVRLLRQLIADQWPDWDVYLFDTASRLKKALQTTVESELPALILLEDNHQNNDSLAALQYIKDSLQFRRIPTLLLATFGNQQLTEDGYASGANSVIVQPADATQSAPVFEKIFRYWLHMAAASRATSRRAA